ncbi:MAG: cytochrome C [Ignavibacteria bacterium]|jgi:nitrate/TMAO reductase-like tetraheme cytochrome c subunit|nr:cytochrome C [Ignavibacteria bacterium]
MRRKYPLSAYNWTSLVGLTIAIIAAIMIIFLFVISAFIQQGSSYLGLVIYILLPAFLIVGLILIPVGMYFKTRKERKNKETEPTRWPQIDLNNERHRNGFIFFAIGTALFLLLSAIGSYGAFNFTESVEFCGTICHTVMKPEYTAYQHSPHARVACVECHVGTGANWYVKSKMSGLYQVYAVTIGKYPRPIPTPVRNLRPARETCEHCHWPSKFYARQLTLERHYLADDTNSEWDINLVLKIGPSISALGLQEGIHWHINPNTKIEYVAKDEQRQTIPWVRYTDLKTGKSTVFKVADDNTNPQTAGTRVMDCIDCHNRPSHNYLPPSVFVNNAINSGIVSKDIPGIKSLAMEIFSKDFSTTDSMMNYIKTQVINHYNETNYYASNKAKVDQAIKGLQTQFSQNIFPEMRVKWSAYANNIGHLNFPGCFRCHDGNHTSSDGKVISKDCNLCHTIVAQGSPQSLEAANVNSTLDFKHPVDVGYSNEMLCTDCHSGLNP